MDNTNHEIRQKEVQITRNIKILIVHQKEMFIEASLGNEEKDFNGFNCYADCCRYPDDLEQLVIWIGGSL